MTRTQHIIYSFIKQYITAEKISPSYEDILKGTKYKSKSQIYKVVDALIKKEYLKKIGKFGDARRIIVNRDYEKGGIKIAKSKH
jgi:SOS-response transcriptional repressor LexA|tara:strand:+ start:1717 stop:1968 length:252 start_codon:yes stop_codon:yes gene_type:complete